MRTVGVWSELTIPIHSRPACSHAPHGRNASWCSTAHCSSVSRRGAQRFSHWPGRGRCCRGEEMCGQSARWRVATVSGPWSVSTNPFGYSVSQSGYPGWPSGKQSVRRRIIFSTVVGFLLSPWWLGQTELWILFHRSVAHFGIRRLFRIWQCETRGTAAYVELFDT